MRYSRPILCQMYMMEFLAHIFYYSIKPQFYGILRHVGVGSYFNQIHFGYRDFTCRTDCTIRSKSSSELLVIKDGCFKVKSFHEVLLNQKYWSTRLLVSIDLICNSLNIIINTFNRTSGGVKVKIPSLGMLTPLPILRFLLMQRPREFQIILIYQSLKVPSTLKILLFMEGVTWFVIYQQFLPTFSMKHWMLWRLHFYS